MPPPKLLFPFHLTTEASVYKKVEKVEGIQTPNHGSASSCEPENDSKTASDVEISSSLLNIKELIPSGSKLSKIVPLLRIHLVFLILVSFLRGTKKKASYESNCKKLK